MDEPSRRRLAFAIAKANGSTASSIYSYSDSRYTNMSGNNGSYYDYDSGSHFSNTYDYGNGSHWNFKISGRNFSGYHYGAGNHFSGNINGQSIQLYDYGAGQWYNYTA